MSLSVVSLQLLGVNQLSVSKLEKTNEQTGGLLQTNEDPVLLLILQFHNYVTQSQKMIIYPRVSH